MTANRLPEDAERILQRLLCGELDPDDSEVQEMMTRHPEMRGEMLRLRSIQGVLSDLAADRAEVAELARGEATDGDRALVRRTMEGTTGARPRRWLPILLAAGLLLGFLWWLWPRDADRPSGMLDRDAIVKIDRAAERILVTFLIELPGQGRYHLRLFDADARMLPAREAFSESGTWQFPEEWRLTLDAAGAPRLLVQVLDGLGEAQQVQSLDLSSLRR